MTTKLIYFAHPIDHRQPEIETEMRLITGELRDRGCCFYNPQAAWTCPRGTRPTAGLQAANQKVLSECDGVVAYLHARVLTVGTVLEVAHAVELGKPVVVWSTTMTASWPLTTLGVPVNDDLDEALDWLITQMGA